MGNLWALLFFGSIVTLLLDSKQEKKALASAPEQKSNPGKEVMVYKNLNKDCYSVKDKKTNKVSAHKKSVALKNVTFKVSEAGRKRVIKEKQKNVHAFVVGEKTKTPSTEGWEKITYDPYKYKSFVFKKNKKPIHQAEMVVLKPDGVYAKT